jgi:hypothetical protein
MDHLTIDMLLMDAVVEAGSIPLLISCGVPRKKFAFWKID